MKLIRHFTALTIAALVALSWQPAKAATTQLLPGEQCFSALAPTSGGPGGTGTGFVGLLGTIAPGSGGTNGTYGGVPLTGGSGTQATANITVSGGVVTQVAILNPGVQYVVGDVLSAASANIGNVTGFSVPISSVAINSSLAGGKVFYYQPNTQIFKQTWQDAAQTILNQNPIPLDANGCAIVYGVGIYRQVLQDSLGNTVWDQLTTDTSAFNSVFWAGIAGGTPNVITITDIGFNGTDGAVINFTALATNTGPATLNPSGYGAISILQDTTAGPVALIPGQIIQGNVISVVYRSQDNSFHLLNPPIQQASGTIGPSCGTTGLKIVNGSPASTNITITANTAVMVSSGGLSINRTPPTFPTLNISTGTVTSTINGMDGESPGTSAWIYLWVIDNGAASATLASAAALNGLNPVLPSGYIYKCLVGAFRVDSSGNLMQMLQYGIHTQYVVTAASNTANMISLASGTAGSVTVPTWVAVSVSAAVPPIGVGIDIAAYGTNDGFVIVAPNNSYGALVADAAAASNPPFMQINLHAGGSTGNTLIRTSMLLESTSIYWASSASNNSLWTSGFTLGGVNAN